MACVNTNAKEPKQLIRFIPRFYDWGEHAWSFGWETGKDNDLVCVKSNLHTSQQGEIALSPVCSNRLLAICAFAIKALLIRIDHNLRGLEG